MNEREKLIELLKQNCHCKDEDCSHCSSKGFCFTHREAEYLLENGVVVPPCKVGDTVYAISRSDIVPIKIDRIQYTPHRLELLGRNERYFGNGTITLYNGSYLEWYLTREEAEKALKGK